MAHGQRAAKNGNGNRDYWSKRYGNDTKCNSRPSRAKHNQLSVKRLTNRAERRIAKQSIEV